jgi:putative copper export protein
MRTLLRSLILLGLVVWVGGLLFFGAVVAPVAFGYVMPMLPDPALGLHVAGAMVRFSLLRLHDIGLVCGVGLLLLCILERATRATRRTIVPQLALLAAMLGLTAYSQYSVIPRMESLRIQAGAAIDNPSATDPAKVDFDRLHNLSTRLEGVVLLCGLGLIVLYARPEPAG